MYADSRPVLSVEDLAKMLNISRAKTYAELRANRIPHIRLQKTVHYFKNGHKPMARKQRFIGATAGAGRVMREYRYLPARELRTSSDNGKRTISGYAAIFSSPSVDLGGFTEKIAPGAFTRSLRDKADVMLLHEHDARKGLLARTKSGTLDLTQDATGLHFRADLPNTTLGNDVAEMVSRGDLAGCSFGFCVPEGGDEWQRLSDGNILRTLRDVDLFDVTVTASPAYPATSVKMRSLLATDGVSNEERERCRLLAAVISRRLRFS